MAPIDSIFGHSLLIKRLEKNKPYVIDYRDMTEIRTIALDIRQQQMTEKFNVYDAILPKFVQGDPARHRQSELMKDSIEYNLISKLFQDTWGNHYNDNRRIRPKMPLFGSVPLNQCAYGENQGN